MKKCRNNVWWTSKLNIKIYLNISKTYRSSKLCVTIWCLSGATAIFKVRLSWNLYVS